MPTTRKAEYGTQRNDQLPMVLHDVGHAALGLAARELQRQAAGDAQRGERDDERVRQAAPHVARRR